MILELLKIEDDLIRKHLLEVVGGWACGEARHRFRYLKLIPILKRHLGKDRVIEIYAQVYIEYLVIGDQWRRSGYQVTEEYTNKAGATNKQQSTLYKTVQQAREKLQYYESCLGLTPAALKRINEKLDNRDGKGSKLDEVLDKIEQINGL